MIINEQTLPYCQGKYNIWCCKSHCTAKKSPPTSICNQSIMLYAADFLSYPRATEVILLAPEPSVPPYLISPFNFLGLNEGKF